MERIRRLGTGFTVAGAIVLGILAFACIAVAHSVQGVVLTALFGSALMAFVAPRRAWLWWLIIWAFAVVGAVIDLRWMQAGGVPADEPCIGVQHPASIFGIAATLLVISGVGMVFGYVGDFVVAVAVRYGATLGWEWGRFVRPAAHALAIFGAIMVWLGLGMLTAMPLQPYAIGERYCWDEYCFMVTSVERVTTLGRPPHVIAAHGEFYVVHATMEAPWWGRYYWSNRRVVVEALVPSWREGVLETPGDLFYDNSNAGQRALGAQAMARAACHEVRGAAEGETLVFDLPRDVEQPRLLLRETLGFGGVLNSLRTLGDYAKPAFNLRYDP